MKDKNKKLMLIVSILVLGIGLTFAYFVVGVNILGTGGSTKLATSDLIRVKYDAGTGKLATSGLNPGHSTSKGFKVTVTPTKTVQDVTYRIFLNITSNTFLVCSDSNYNAITNDCEKDAEELIYILKDGNGNEIARGDLTNGVTGEIELAREAKKVAIETDYNYTIEINFKDTNKDQNHNQNKTIIGEVKVEFAEPDTSDLNIMAVYVEKEDKPGKYDSVDQIPINKALNTEKSYCEANGEKVGGIEFNYNSHTGMMGVNNFNIKGTKCYLYFGKLPTSEDTIAKLNVQNIKEGTPDFTVVATGAETEENNGVYVTDDLMYGEGAKTYYWRGAATTNHVIFANKCWRIVRINGDGSIRLIYNGLVLSENVCTGNGSYSSSIIGSSEYNKVNDRSEYVGWTYDLENQRPSSTIRGSSASLKTYLEGWLDDVNNFSDEQKRQITNGNFCNDRNLISGDTWASKPSGSFKYAAYSRVNEGMKKPSLACDVNDTYNLTIGIITSDEVQFAGGIGSARNEYYYLYNGQAYWTMTPYDWYGGRNADIFYVSSGGVLGGWNVIGSNPTPKVRPVINLRSDVTFNEGSDGTQNNPYIVQ